MIMNVTSDVHNHITAIDINKNIDDNQNTGINIRCIIEIHLHIYCSNTGICDFCAGRPMRARPTKTRRRRCEGGTQSGAEPGLLMLDFSKRS
jgi:hypothetical protein